MPALFPLFLHSAYNHQTKRYLLQSIKKPSLIFKCPPWALMKTWIASHLPLCNCCHGFLQAEKENRAAVIPILIRHLWTRETQQKGAAPWSRTYYSHTGLYTWFNAQLSVSSLKFLIFFLYHLPFHAFLQRSPILWFFQGPHKLCMPQIWPMNEKTNNKSWVIFAIVSLSPFCIDFPTYVTDYLYMQYVSAYKR